MHVQNKKYGNFVSICRLTGKYAAQKLNKNTVLHGSEQLSRVIFMHQTEVDI